MNYELFNDFEKAEQVPTGLLTELTPGKNTVSENEINSITGHTTGTPPVNAPQPQGGNFPGMGSQPQANGQQSLNLGNMVTPEMSVQFFNILIPAAFAILINRFSDVKCFKEQFEATPKEIEIIKPVLAKYLDSINFNVDNPATALIITVAFIYGSKAVEVLNGKPKGTIKTGDFTAPMANVRQQQQKPATGLKKDGTPRKPRPTGITYNKNQ